MKFNKVKGTEDYYPEEKSIQQQIFSTLRTIANRYNFNEVETPALETLGLLTAKGGEEISSQIFTLDKRGKEELGLRFDLTVPITRMFVAKQLELPKPAKWFGLSRMWRYERPQKGRLREFYQFSAEIFGTDSKYAVAETLQLLIDMLQSLGLTKKDFIIKVNNRQFLEGVLDCLDCDFEQTVKVIDKYKKMSGQEFLDELKQAYVKEQQATTILQLLQLQDTPAKMFQEVFKKVNYTNSKKSTKGVNELMDILELLPESFVELDFSIARGLAYYTGTVFEVYDRKGKFRAIAGGGQYDELTALLGGRKTPAVGFGLGYSTLRLLLEEKGLLPQPQTAPEYAVIVMTGYTVSLMTFVQQLREKYSVYVDLKERKPKKQLDYASSIGAQKAIFYGTEEQATGIFTVKDLKTGEEKKVKKEELLT
ncbi:histidine--tRNA ligase [Candidatus Woesearchaeota archaeon]|nr:histidine--tRNA ligase [Candidatus Woesearchaeota archaeon]